MLGIRLRGLRSARGWTLEELAERSGLSKPFLSRLESGTRQPSIAAVLTLARVFGVPMGSLFEPRFADEPCIVVRAGDASIRHGDGVSYVPMSSASPFNLQPIRLDIASTRQGAEQYQHEGEEWIYVLSGRLQLSLGEKQYVIDAGDAAHFDSRLPHRLDALDGKDASIVLVACPIPIALNSRREAVEMTAELVG
ncbi:MAG TPA: XRE family transcriptional regulator [Tepidisphaeraceae bacterium]|nr:XRE family transcriptional regulator [Tepidisphaeraceae bacterium]